MGSDEAWRVDAACLGADIDLFFPIPGSNAARRAIRDWCAGCPVQVPCRDTADLDEYRMGVFGAMTAVQRAEHERTGRLPTPPAGCAWEWDDQHKGWQLAWSVGHERGEG